jgi:O-antigen/teichoic acid export membrane protein
MLKRNFWKTIPVNLSQALTGFLAITIYTHLLTPAEYGHFAVAQSVMLVSYVLLFKWLDASMARFYAAAQEDGSLRNHFRSAYTTFAFWAVITMGVSVGVTLALPLDPTMQTVVLAAIAAVHARALLMMGIETHLAAGEIKSYVMIEAGGAWLCLLMGVICVKLGFAGAGPLAGLAVGSAIVLLFDLPRMLLRAKGGTVVPAKVKAYAHYGLPLAYSVGVTLLLSTTDRMMLALFHGDAAAGTYAAGYNLATRIVEILFMAVWLMASPMAVMAMEQKGASAAQKVLRDSADLLLLSAIPAAVGIALVAPELVQLLIAPAYHATALTIVPLAALTGALSGVLFYYLEQAFTLSKATKRLFIVNTIILLVQIAAGLYLIPHYGAVGAISANILAISIGIGLAIVIGRQYIALPIPLVDMGKCALACTGMAAVVHIIAIADPLVALLVKAATGAIVFAAAALLLNLGDVRTLLQRFQHREKSA